MDVFFFFLTYVRILGIFSLSWCSYIRLHPYQAPETCGESTDYVSGGNHPGSIIVRIITTTAPVGVVDCRRPRSDVRVPEVLIIG